MFCPNCGNNCGNANFCASCGTKLPQAAAPAVQSGEWKAGMPCPNCGGTQLDGHKCAFCGSQLIIDTPSVRVNIEPLPYGVHDGISGYLELKEEYLILCTWKFFRKFQKKYHVPYRDLKAVQYKKGRGSDVSYISIRWEGNAHIPVPQRYWDSLDDPMSMRFYPEDEKLFEQICSALQCRIDQNNFTTKIYQIVNILQQYLNRIM